MQPKSLSLPTMAGRAVAAYKPVNRAYNQRSLLLALQNIEWKMLKEKGVRK